ncbi:uncharacterized protein LOC125509412 isoform X3 [Triticum urartu]|uniref:uncharacterized protein LOC125509410 isoform X3 n=1 Tax=Triticum urartu TaxID=4572 RepID=UPI002043976E|nr:uncharacterized protein LOC125509410 isoform X3 [Triticum urartu]XP_048530340.1 uncharacterized protein LOC125509412 isoform X3 [Triticum urartu]
MGAAFLSSWPWDNLGFFKYVLYGPLVGKALAGRAWEAASPDRWLCLLLALFALRALTYQLWSSYSNMLFLTRRRRIVRDGVDFEQIDKEWDWDNFLILQITMAATALYVFPSLRHLPGWNTGGLAVAAVLHVAATEPLFYAAHRAFHGARLFARYHALHHSNMVPTPFTAGFATPLEHVVLGLLMALPLAGACAAGLGSVGLTFAYVLSFDFLRAMGHCNVELFPGGLFRSLPFLRYLIYTPTDGRGAGLRVPGARGGRDAVDARAVRDADLRLHALRGAGLPAAALAHRAALHVHGLGLVQDLRHLLLPPPRQAAPDLGRPQIRLPLFPAVRQGRHQRPDRAGHPEGRQDGRQSRQPCSSEQERGAQRRRHAVREQAPEPPGARRPRQHAHGRGHPQRDPQGHHRGLHDRRHLQARQGHRALPLQEEDPRHDDDAVDGEVPEDPEGGGGGGPAVPGAGDQVPVGGAVQDVDRRQVAVAAGAAVGAAGHALPPVRGAPHPGLPPGLHLRQARRHAPPQGRPGPRLLRVLAGARGGARLPRRRGRALPRGLRAPRGGRHRHRPHRRRLGGGAQARHPARLIAPPRSALPAPSV